MLILDQPFNCEAKKTEAQNPLQEVLVSGQTETRTYSANAPPIVSLHPTSNSEFIQIE